MKREIKYRSWDDPTGTPAGMCYCIRPDCDADAIMQFTGILDKKGKEIYEGDVIKGTRPVKNREGRITKEVRFISVVEYDSWWGAFRRKGVKQYQGLSAALMYGKELEVIGNIYENPELMEP
jgi:uncharacterized phage protein (TIGR01671 family)